MRLTLAAALALAILSMRCHALQDIPQSSAVECYRPPTWHPDYLGKYSPVCMYVLSSVKSLLRLERSAEQAVFAAAAWSWLEDASLCIFLVENHLEPLFFMARHYLPFGTGSVQFEMLKFYHKQVLRRVLVADTEPLEIDDSICLPYAAMLLPAVKICRIKIERTCNMKYRYVAAPGNADSFREEGIKIHSKLDFKYFDSPDPAIQNRGVYAKGNIKNGIK